MCEKPLRDRVHVARGKNVDAGRAAERSISTNEDSSTAAASSRSDLGRSSSNRDSYTAPATSVEDARSGSARFQSRWMLGDEGVALLAQWRGLRQLVSLDVSHNAIGDSGAAALAAAKLLRHSTINVKGS